MTSLSSDGRKSQIASAFGAAAAVYDDHASIQRIAAQTVADLASLLPVPDVPSILEVGCGTGLLTREIGMRWPSGSLVATDLAGEMVAKAADGAMIAGTFLPMDGEKPWFDGAHFDLILSSLAFQWFDDLPLALARLHSLLRPGGSLIFSTMGERSFARWRDAHAQCGVDAGVPIYPAMDDLRDMLAPYTDAFAFDEEYPLPCGNARGLIGHLRGIGATVPVLGRSPLSPAALRRVMATFDANGAQDGYHILFGRITRLV
ncbi:MAG: methyltransferase domain-containing protein [Sphingobium sp.]